MLAQLLFSSNAAASADIGKVSMLSGNADVLRGTGPSIPLSTGDAIRQLDIIRTRKNSLLEIAMNDGSRLTIGESTRLDIKEYLAGKKPRGRLDLMRGRIRAVVSDIFSRRKESFQIKAATAVVGVQGTDFIVIADAMKTRIEVLKGVVSVKSTDPGVRKTRTLTAGQAAVVKKHAQPVLITGTRRNEFGSGSSLDIISGGTQPDSPVLITPETSSGSAPPALPPIPNPPGR